MQRQKTTHFTCLLCPAPEIGYSTHLSSNHRGACTRETLRMRNKQSYVARVGNIRKGYVVFCSTFRPDFRPENRTGVFALLCLCVVLLGCSGGFHNGLTGSIHASIQVQHDVCAFFGSAPFARQVPGTTVWRACGAVCFAGSAESCTIHNLTS